MTAIALEGVGKDYGSTTAVHSVDLVIPSGSLYFLLGPSGCGKTTLLRMIAGFIDPTRGRIRFGTRDVTGVPPNRRNAGMVFQSYALWPHLTVFENVAFGLDVRKVAKPQRQQRVMAALEQVQMQAYAQRRPNELSGGQQQRVALARALVIEPTVLLLDEPLSNLDAKLRLEMRSEIRRLCSTLRITTVYVTHDQKEALSMADEMAVLRDGRIVQRGPAQKLYRRPASRFVAEFLGETNFLEARVARTDGDVVTFATAAGELRSTAWEGAFGGRSDAPESGAPVLLSLRPEALRIRGDGAGISASGSPGRTGSAGSAREDAGAGSGRLNPASTLPSSLPGHVGGTTYLGEATQYAVELASGESLKVQESNARTLRSGPVRLDIDPDDVVALPR
ncbi:MAG TPA: ABC transporter ATP-binding protein [Phycisphaerales bacterium]|nr:ABC transporter ATP-binding protein [Phycisphaerales bacterium]